MAIELEEGVDWSDAIGRIEKLPRGEARNIVFASGKSMLVEHSHDGTVRVLIKGNGDEHWIYPDNLKALADILRVGVEQRGQS